ncbi:hypothetical protein [Thermocatellispora tengchongensis]|uniref:hypothetical protein n=1 Tax=Thermocatellispora tengchongensis TaxID=1073253 RepID=UPI0036352A1D
MKAAVARHAAVVVRRAGPGVGAGARRQGRISTAPITRMPCLVRSRSAARTSPEPSGVPSTSRALSARARSCRSSPRSRVIGMTAGRSTVNSARSSQGAPTGRTRRWPPGRAARMAAASSCSGPGEADARRRRAGRGSASAPLRSTASSASTATRVSRSTSRGERSRVSSRSRATAAPAPASRPSITPLPR